MRLIQGSIRQRCVSSLRNVFYNPDKRKVPPNRSFQSWRRTPCRASIRGFSSLQSDHDFPTHYNNALVVENGTKVIVSFDNDQQSAFHAPWLWSNDASSVHPTSGQRLKTPGGYSWNTKIKSAVIVNSANERHVPPGVVLPFPPPPRGSSHPIGNVYPANASETVDSDSLCLCVTWESANEKDSFVSYYDLEWLWQWKYDQEWLDSRRDQTKVTTRQALQSGDDAIPTFDYNDLELNAREFAFQLLHAIVESGAGLVQNAPVEFADSLSSPVATIGRLLGGSLSHGALYGDMFDVKSVPNANNIAYTNVSLGPHQDLAYYESKPGLQLLQCISNKGVIGGDSVLVDAMAAAEEFQQLAPKHFETLTKCPATFVKQRDGADMMYRRPHIGIDDSGAVVSVNWSPPFEGPLAVSPDFVEPYYRAYAAFERMVDNSLPKDRSSMEPSLLKELNDYAETYTWERRLESGEILVFNNMRMLHGRRGYSFDEDGVGDRHLLGCYTNLDDTLNRYRVLQRERNGGGLSVRNAGNGSCGMP